VLATSTSEGCESLGLVLFSAPFVRPQDEKWQTDAICRCSSTCNYYDSSSSSSIMNSPLSRIPSSWYAKVEWRLLN